MSRGAFSDGVSCTGNAGCSAVGYDQTPKGEIMPVGVTWNGSHWGSASASRAVAQGGQAGNPPPGTSS